jgi:hypothetical protein
MNPDITSKTDELVYSVHDLHLRFLFAFEEHLTTHLAVELRYRQRKLLECENINYILKYMYYYYYYYYYYYTGLPLWSIGQSFWLQIRRPGFDSRHYQKNK